MSSTWVGSPRTGLGETVLRARDALPEGAPRALLAGVEAAVFSWLCVVVPAVAAYVATAAAPALGDATWVQAAAVGSGVWRLAHGGALGASGATVTLVPLGLTALAVGLTTLSLQRARVVTGAGAVAAALGYAMVAFVLATLPPASAGGPGKVAVGALLVGSAGAFLGRRRGRGRTPLAVHPTVNRQLGRLPAGLRTATAAGLRGAAVAGAALFTLGVVLLGVSLVAGNAALVETLAVLRADALGLVMILLASALLVPTLAVWAVSWAAGSGFAVGEGTLITPADVTVGPLPAFPLLAGLPGASPLGPWIPALVVLVGAATGWFLHRRVPQPGLLGSVASALVAALACGAGAALLGAAAGGSVGPGRMAQVGPDPVAFAAAVTAEVGLPAVLVVVLARPTTVARGRDLLRRGGAEGRRLFEAIRPRRA